MHFPLPYLETNLNKDDPFTTHFMTTLSHSFAYNDTAQALGVRTPFWDYKKLIYIEFEKGQTPLSIPENPHNVFHNSHSLYRQQAITVLHPHEGHGTWEKNSFGSAASVDVKQKQYSAAVATMQGITGYQSVNGSYIHVFSDEEHLQQAFDLLKISHMKTREALVKHMYEQFAKPVIDAFEEANHYREPRRRISKVTPAQKKTVLSA